MSTPVVVDFPLRGEWTAPNTPGTKVPSHGTHVLGTQREDCHGWQLVRNGIPNAENLEEAEQLAQSNPYIASIRVYEIRTKEARAHMNVSRLQGGRRSRSGEGHDPHFLPVHEGRQAASVRRATV